MAILINARNVLIDKISKLTGITYLDSDLILDNVRPYVGTSSRRNSSVDVTYGGETISVHYDRISLSEISSYNRPKGTPLDRKNTIYELLPHLYKYLGFDLTEDDVEDGSIVDAGTDMYLVSLVAKESSLLWTGSIDIYFRDLPGIDGILFSKVNMGYI